MRIAPNAKCQRMLALALWLVIFVKNNEKNDTSRSYRTPNAQEDVSTCTGD